MGKKSFTLIELIVVIAIIAVLAAVIAPQVLRAIEKAKIARTVSDTKAIAKAAKMMYLDTGMWPGTNWDEGPWDILGDAELGEGFVFKGDDPDMPDTWEGPYLEKWSKNPWGRWYLWDYNAFDQVDNDGVGQEHTLSIDIDNMPAGIPDTGERLSSDVLIRIDAILDDGNISSGKLQFIDVYGEEFSYIVAQGE